MERLNLVQVNRIEDKFFIQNLLTARESWMTDAELVWAKPDVETEEECINIMYEAVGASTEGTNKPELRISKNAERAIEKALNDKNFLKEEITGKQAVLGFQDDEEAD